MWRVGIGSHRYGRRCMAIIIAMAMAMRALEDDGGTKNYHMAGILPWIARLRRAAMLVRGSNEANLPEMGIGRSLALAPLKGRSAVAVRVYA